MPIKSKIINKYLTMYIYKDSGQTSSQDRSLLNDSHGRVGAIS